MIYAYLRVSTDRQSVENQRFEILKVASVRKVVIDEWIEETVSGAKSASDRQLGEVIAKMKKDDQLYVPELPELDVPCWKLCRSFISAWRRMPK